RRDFAGRAIPLASRAAHVALPQRTARPSRSWQRKQRPRRTGARSRQDRHSAGTAGSITNPPGEGTDPAARLAALAQRPPAPPTWSRRAGRRRPGGCSTARTARGTGRRARGRTGTAAARPAGSLPLGPPREAAPRHVFGPDQDGAVGLVGAGPNE